MNLFIDGNFDVCDLRLSYLIFQTNMSFKPILDVNSLQYPEDNIPLYYNTTNGKKTDINQKNVFGLTPLMIACRDCNLKEVQVLLNKESIKVNEQDVGGNTAIFYAIEGDSVEIVDLFTNDSLFWTNNWNHVNIFNETAPLLALKKGSRKMIEKLKLIEDINWTIQDKNGNNGPMISVINNNCEMLRYFLRKSIINFNETNEKGETLLMLGMLSKQPFLHFHQYWIKSNCFWFG